MVDVDLNGIQFEVNGWAKSGTLPGPGGDGVYGPGNACLFAASGTKLSPG
jgi:hypothetical protein